MLMCLLYSDTLKLNPLQFSVLIQLVCKSVRGLLENISEQTV